VRTQSRDLNVCVFLESAATSSCVYVYSRVYVYART